MGKLIITFETNDEINLLENFLTQIDMEEEEHMHVLVDEGGELVNTRYFECLALQIHVAKQTGKDVGILRRTAEILLEHEDLFDLLEVALVVNGVIADNLEPEGHNDEYLLRAFAY